MMVTWSRKLVEFSMDYLASATCLARIFHELLSQQVIHEISGLYGSILQLTLDEKSVLRTSC
jgi:hypothetical protein